jgi:acetyl esterase/lipase
VVLLFRLLLARLLCAVALVLLFLTSWIVLPGFTRPLLALAIGAPELAPWLAPIGLIVTLLAWITGPPAALAPRVAMMLATAATALAVVPLVQLPSTLRRFDDAMRQALGPDPLRDLPADRRARLRPAPVVVTDLYRGISASDIRRSPADVEITRDIVVSTYDGGRLTVDIYRPPTSDSRGAARVPCVVQIYGGSWQGGEPGDHAKVATYLASRGFVVFAIDYRHAPQWQWPVQIEDVRAALRWVREHAAAYDGDASRLALLGRSAGAHLAMLAAYEPGAPPIDAVVNFYGPVALADGYRNPPVPDPIAIRPIEEAFLGGPPDRVPDRYSAASPITYVTRPLPPTLLIYGSRDHVVLSRFGRMLDERLRATGTTSILLEIPWAEHAFDILPSGLSGQISLYYTERFLSWALLRPKDSPAGTSDPPR